MLFMCIFKAVYLSILYNEGKHFKHSYLHKCVVVALDAPSMQESWAEKIPNLHLEVEGEPSGRVSGSGSEQA